MFVSVQCHDSLLFKWTSKTTFGRVRQKQVPVDSDDVMICFLVIFIIIFIKSIIITTSITIIHSGSSESHDPSWPPSNHLEDAHPTESVLSQLEIIIVVLKIILKMRIALRVYFLN